MQCLSESFNVDPESAADKEKYSLAPASLLTILDVYLKTKAKSTASTPAPAAKPAPAASSSSASVDKAGAEKLKAEGNALMSQKLYDSAIQKYTEAIAKDPSNAVYLSNRAAAWGGVGQHEKAVEDAQKALEVDPTFSKAFSRLGCVDRIRLRVLISVTLISRLAITRTPSTPTSLVSSLILPTPT